MQLPGAAELDRVSHASSSLLCPAAAGQVADEVALNSAKVGRTDPKPCGMAGALTRTRNVGPAGRAKLHANRRIRDFACSDARRTGGAASAG